MARLLAFQTLAAATAMIWGFYIIGQSLHAWLRASASIRSKINGVDTYAQWFAAKGPVVVGRFFLATCLFLIFEYGSTNWFPTLAVSGGLPVKVAIAGVFGYFSDSVLDQAATRLGFDKEIPPSQG